MLQPFTALYSQFIYHFQNRTASKAREHLFYILKESWLTFLRNAIGEQMLQGVFNT